MDIEGEYDVLRSLDLRAIGVEVRCVESHENRSASEAKALLRTLESFYYGQGTDFTLVSDPCSEVRAAQS